MNKFCLQEDYCKDNLQLNSLINHNFMQCKKCKLKCIRKGWYKNTQRYCCKSCNIYQQSNYIYKQRTEADTNMIITLNNEGMGISSMARVLGFAKSSIVRHIKTIAASIVSPFSHELNQDYEVDELQTFIQNKKKICFLMYAINKLTGRVIDFKVGQRTKENLSKVIDSVLFRSPHKIYSDGLIVYRSIIPAAIHRYSKHCINHIERKNLTLRTHLKRLNRKTICFSKNLLMLNACLKIYLWGKT